SALASHFEGGGNTALGNTALNNNDGSGPGTAGGNTRVRSAGLFINADKAMNTALGAGALLFYQGGSQTGVSAFALINHNFATGNTAVGTQALQNNDSSAAGVAIENNAFGFQALLNNVNGFQNNAFGFEALSKTDSSALGLANANNAFGDGALRSNVDGFFNN